MRNLNEKTIDEASKKADYLVMAEYIKAFAKDQDGKPRIASRKSPLAACKNYLIDYENPRGSGRISIK